MKDSTNRTYEDLQTDIEQCIIGKEGDLNQSSPQFYIGSNMVNTPLDANGDVDSNDSNDASDSGDDSGDSSQDSTVASGSVNSISGSANLGLRGTAGATDLKTIAEGKKYLLIDFFSTDVRLLHPVCCDGRTKSGRLWRDV